MKQKILVIWNDHLHYQIDEFFKNNTDVDVIITSNEIYPEETIIKQFKNVYYYDGPRWYNQTKEDEQNIENLFLQIFKDNQYAYLLPTWQDKHIEFYSYINEKTKMPGISSFKDLKGKHNYYKIFNELGIPTPANYISSYNYPLICKPSYGSGSEGVYICNSKEELQNFCKENNTDDYIFQEYKQGKTVCIVGHIYQSKVNIDLIYDIEISAPPYCAEIGFIFPSSFDYLKNNITNYLQKFSEYIKLDNSPFMLDLIIDDSDNFYFIDFSARLSNSIYDLMYYTDNKDYLYNITNKILNDVNFTVKTSKCFIKKHFSTYQTDSNINDKGIVSYKLSNKKLDNMFKNDFDICDCKNYVISVNNDFDLCYENLNKFLNSIQSNLK